MQRWEKIKRKGERDERGMKEGEERAHKLTEE